MPPLLCARAGLVAGYPHHVRSSCLGDGPVMSVGGDRVVLYQKSGDFFIFMYLLALDFLPLIQLSYI